MAVEALTDAAELDDAARAELWMPLDLNVGANEGAGVLVDLGGRDGLGLFDGEDLVIDELAVGLTPSLNDLLGRVRLPGHGAGDRALHGPADDLLLLLWVPSPDDDLTDDARQGLSPIEAPPGDLAGRRVVAVSGLARPTSFYEVLDRLGAKLVEALEFRDHHAYGQADWQRIGQAARRADLVVCTEKDLVKLRRFPFARGHLFAVRVDFALAAADEASLLDRIVGAAGIGRLLRDGSGRATPGGRTPAPEAVG